jgi:hypothetical protein
MPLVLNLSVFVWCLNMFLMVFCVRKAILSCVSLKILVICPTSLLRYVKVAQFVFCFGSLRVLCFYNCDGIFSIGLHYIHFFVACLL